MQVYCHKSSKEKGHANFLEGFIQFSFPVLEKRTRQSSSWLKITQYISTKTTLKTSIHGALSVRPHWSVVTI